MVQKRYPERKPLHVEFSFHVGWVALDTYGTDNSNTIKTPDGREIPVVMGWTDHGKLIGFRGGTALHKFESEWRAIMDRVVNHGLAVAMDGGPR